MSHIKKKLQNKPIIKKERLDTISMRPSQKKFQNVVINFLLSPNLYKQCLLLLKTFIVNLKKIKLL